MGVGNDAAGWDSGSDPGIEVALGTTIGEGVDDNGTCGGAGC